ncbi:integrase [Fictibacillus phosphorivorans]|uniref:Integrase n=1 Tax=Fictibacillus phosphorivorans TaxID=1221500 RepID=A0A160IQ72_9BACL|nr:tyrosine-type recombinase/integrase [Fictibacillus phosphorivorans]ANC78260.1 integrase [Fictibacillus phosphorivorans]
MSFNYFENKKKVKKRQPHKRKSEKAIQRDTVQIIFEKFLDSKVKQNLRPSSLNQHVGLYKNISKFHSTQSNSPFYLADITTDFISNWVHWLKHEAKKNDGHAYMPKHAQTVGLSDASIYGKIKYLKTFLGWCIKEDLIKKNPFIKWEGFRRDTINIDILSREEINSLLNVAKMHSKKSFKHFRDYVLLHLLIDCMCRINEALMLAPCDIDNVNRTIIIRSTNAKSRKARIIPLSNKTYRLLIHLIEENIQFESEVDDLVFLSLSGRMLNNNNCLRDFKKYAVEAGIKKRFYIHLLRHSVATHYLSSLGDVESLRKILGHADLRTVLTYAHMADETVAEKHAKSGFFGSENVTSRKRKNNLKKR